MKTPKAILMAFLIAIISSTTESCADDSGEIMSISEEEAKQDFAFEAVMYNNSGENFVTFRGHSFDIRPNKVKQYGYDSDGVYRSYYETSSVVTVIIDERKIDTCGSTILFKDTNLKIDPMEIDIEPLVPSEDSGYAGSELTAKDYQTLTKWWLNTHSGKDNKNKRLILIQSQDGYNIGTVEGENVNWKISEKLPKTTLIEVDDKLLYIHRCNFTIIDTDLFNNVVLPDNMI